MVEGGEIGDAVPRVFRNVVRARKYVRRARRS